MKKLFLFVFAAIFALGLSSCNKDEDESIVGTWTNVSFTPDIVTSVPALTQLLKTEMGENFSADGNSYVTFRNNGTGTDGYDEFTYTYSGGVLSIFYPGAPDENMSGIASINGKTMTMTVDFLPSMLAEEEFMDYIHDLFGSSATITRARAILTMQKQ